jgi:hypothetical protein
VKKMKIANGATWRTGDNAAGSPDWGVMAGAWKVIHWTGQALET